MKPNHSIELAGSECAIRRCHPVMRQLRTHHESVDAFVAQVLKQQQAGYHLAYVTADEAVRAVAGYRYLDNLAWGKFMYIDDLVSDESARGTGLGSRLFDWLVEQARENGCTEFHLDSGVQRLAAHRFYLGKMMDITSHHFAMKLKG